MGNDELDYDDPEVEANWISARRNEVIRYLELEGISHGGVDDEPDYYVAPHASVWRVTDSTHKDRIAFWVICGDLPTDRVSADEAHDAREVLAHFGRSWAEVAACMKAGKKHPAITIGTPDEWEQLGPILEDLAETLSEISGDDALWEEQE